jgi:hypothetical protein
MTYQYFFVRGPQVGLAGSSYSRGQKGRVGQGHVRQRARPRGHLQSKARSAANNSPNNDGQFLPILLVFWLFVIGGTYNQKQGALLTTVQIMIVRSV